MGELKPPGKPFDISKWEVQDAWEKVKANKGAPHCPKVFRVMRSCVWFLRAGHGLAAC